MSFAFLRTKSDLMLLFRKNARFSSVVDDNVNLAARRQSMKKAAGQFGDAKSLPVRLSYREPAFQASGISRHGIAAEPIDHRYEEIQLERADFAIVNDLSGFGEIDVADDRC